MLRLALLVLIPSAAFAVTIDESQAQFSMLAKRASVAAHVRVMYQSHRLAGVGPGAMRIVTDSHCEVLDAAYGATIGESLVITSLGGYYGNIGQRVFGLESLAPNDELAVLLSEDGYMQGGRRVVGLTMGVYQVVDAPSLDAAERPILGHASSVFPSRDDEDVPFTLGSFLQRARDAKGGVK